MIIVDEKVRLRYQSNRESFEVSVNGSAYQSTSQPSAQALSQVNFYINATTGDDENDGLTSGTALKTINEYLRRVGDGIVTVLQQVHLSGSFNEGDYFFRAHYRMGVEFWGERTVIGTGTVTAVQAWSQAAETDGQITDTAIPTSWTASGYVGNMIVLTSGANSGAIGWVAKDLGTKTMRHSPMSKAFFNTLVSPAVNDAYEVVSLTTITGSFIFQGWSSGWGVNFADIHFHLTATQFMGWFGALQGFMYLVGCEVSADASVQAVQVGHVLDLFESKFHLGGNRFDVTQGSMFGVLFDLLGSRVYGSEGAVVELDNSLLQADIGGNYTPKITVSRAGSCYMYGGVVGYYDENDATSAMFIAKYGGGIYNYGVKCFGTGNAGDGIRVHSGSMVTYKDGDNMADHFNMTVAGNETLIGGTAKTYAVLAATGFVNTANNAMIVPTTEN